MIEPVDSCGGSTHSRQQPVVEAVTALLLYGLLTAAAAAGAFLLGSQQATTHCATLCKYDSIIRCVVCFDRSALLAAASAAAVHAAAAAAAAAVAAAAAHSAGGTKDLRIYFSADSAMVVACSPVDSQLAHVLYSTIQAATS